MNENTWLNGWMKDDYVKMKQEHFNIIDNHINKPIKNILDIGCGMAFESRYFYKKYNSQLFLIDGDYKNNQDYQYRHNRYEDKANLKYYSNLKDLDNFFQKENISNYKLIDCEKIDISEGIYFELICSYLSCGFHYSLETYKDLIKKHSNKDTILIFTLRKNKNHNCNIKKVLHETEKYISAEISF
jgi:SAM-dependent methyltransferase